jgi:glutamate synthase (NADPH/NADH) small chain
MSALKSEIEYAKLDGIKLVLNTQPVEITETGIKTVKTYYNEEGRLEIQQGSESEISCDSVIVAVGHGARSLIVNSSKGIDVNHKGLVITDESGQTTRQGVFSSGDVVTGAKTVVQAMVNSKQAADAIDAYVTSLLQKDK